MSGQEIVAAPTTLMQPNDAGEVVLRNPSTGEMVLLSDAEDSQLGAFMDAVTDWTERAQEARRVAGDELRRRMDRDASWTRYAGPWKFTAPSPAPSEAIPEPAKLRGSLEKLVTRGEFTQAALDAALPVKVVTTIGVNRSKLTALGKASEAAARTIKRFTVKTPRANRPVTMSRRD